jgi:hypothetical protein
MCKSGIASAFVVQQDQITRVLERRSGGRARAGRRRVEEGPMVRQITPRRSRLLRYATAAALLFGPWHCFGPWHVAASAQEEPTEHVTATLTCGSHSANPAALKAFQVDLQFKVFGSLWLADTTTGGQPGTEKFRGVLSPSGTMLIAGQGKADDGTTWTYEFSGRKSSNGITILRGSLKSATPKGARTCSLTLKPKGN